MLFVLLQLVWTQHAVDDGTCPSPFAISDKFTLSHVIVVMHDFSPLYKVSGIQEKGGADHARGSDSERHGSPCGRR